jgi:ABC-type nickel/cobalt efflux system permease component RcnA
MFVWVAIPVVLIMPFKPQTPLSVALSFELRQKAAVVTLVGAILLFALLVRLARNATRWWQWPPIVLLAALGAAPTWFARQNHFEWMFNPLAHPAYASAREAAAFVDPADMVIAVGLGGDAVAYPVRQMAYHHVVNDQVGGVPIVSTY